jgi:hypothetical protein
MIFPAKLISRAASSVAAKLTGRSPHGANMPPNMNTNGRDDVDST